MVEKENKKKLTEGNVVSTNLRDDGTLEIYVGNSLLTEIEDGREDEDFVEEVLNGMGYKWNADGTVSKLKESIKSIKEAPYYELSPRYDARQSFYGKAHIDTGDNDDQNRLYSYDTLVAEIKDGKPVVYGTYSATTLRHIKDWLKQNGFKAETAKQIMQDYGTDSESSVQPSAQPSGKSYYELSPRYDARPSFYGKAYVERGDDRDRLWSYDTLVAEIKDDRPVVYGTYSATTLRHIKDWLKQKGFKAETAKQIMQDYGVTESLHESWRGSDVIDMDYHGDWADPDLVYDDHVFNYWDIEDALWDMFLEETGYSDSDSEDPQVEAEFNEFVRDRAPSYLDDVMSFGYFKDGSKSWHDD